MVEPKPLTEKELYEWEQCRKEERLEKMPDTYVFPGVYYYTSGLGELDERVHVDPDVPDNEQVIVLDADFVTKASSREICNTIVHELMHYYLDVEHGYPASFQYHNIAEFIEFWHDYCKRGHWHKRLLRGKRRPTCSDCKHSGPLSLGDDYHGRGIYKTVSCRKGVRPATDKFTLGCDDLELKEGVRDEIMLLDEIYESEEGSKPSSQHAPRSLRGDLSD